MKNKWLLIIGGILLMFLIYTAGVQDGEDVKYTEGDDRAATFLEVLSAKGIENVDEVLLRDYVYHYQLQPDGHGLALVAFDEEPDASGLNYARMYTTSNGGVKWTVLHDMFAYTPGPDVFLYMGDVALIAASQSKGINGKIIMSYDRGLNWEVNLKFTDVIDYDPQKYPDLNPYVINYNAHTGIVTFGWKEHADSGEYLLISQFDVNKQEMVEEVYRSPAFAR